MYRWEVVYLPDYEDCNRNVIDVGVKAMRGKVIALGDKREQGLVLSVDRTYFQPDTSLVLSSGVDCIRVGQTIVSLPSDEDSNPIGAYWKEVDGRQVRIFGTGGWPWWTQIVGWYDEEGFSPSPGWAVWERDHKKSTVELSERDKHTSLGTCLSSCGDGFKDVLRGEYTNLPQKVYQIEGLGKDAVLGRAPIASKKFKQECTNGV